MPPSEGGVGPTAGTTAEPSVHGWDYAGLERGVPLRGREAARPPEGPAPGSPPGAAVGSAARLLRAIRRRPSAAAGLALLGLLLVLVVLGPALAPHHPAAVNPDARLQGPGGVYPLGTDGLGRCLLSRLLHGARWSLGPAVLAMGAVVAVGVAVGAAAGYAGGLMDTVLMRAVDVLLAFPALVPAVAIVGMLGPGVWHLTVAVAAVWWAGYARVVRGLVLSSRERPYVQAARALGFGSSRIVFRHVLPGVLPSVVVLASVDTGAVILTVTALSFLGLGVQPPTPEWGAMLADARGFLLTAPQLMLWPGLAISLAVIACNLVGEGLRDLADPRLAHR